MASVGDNGGGGERGAADAGRWHVNLVYDPATDQMDIGGQAPSYDAMLAMLERAIRATEDKRKLEVARAMRQQLDADARAAAVVQDVLKRR